MKTTYEDFEWMTIKGLEKQLAFSSSKFVSTRFETIEDEIKAKQLLNKLADLIDGV